MVAIRMRFKSISVTLMMTTVLNGSIYEKKKKTAFEINNMFFFLLNLFHICMGLTDHYM